MKTKKDEYISLKEAAKLSGYTADYLGQLIRQGKLEGQQVFSNVAWVTTEDALRAYVDTNKKGSVPKKPPTRHVLDSPEKLSAFYINISRGVLIVLGIFLLLLIYVFSVTVDARIERSYLNHSTHEYGS